MSKIGQTIIDLALSLSIGAIIVAAAFVLSGVVLAFVIFVALLLTFAFFADFALGLWRKLERIRSPPRRR